MNVAFGKSKLTGSFDSGLSVGGIGSAARASSFICEMVLGWRPLVSIFVRSFSSSVRAYWLVGSSCTARCISSIASRSRPASCSFLPASKWAWAAWVLARSRPAR